MNLNRNPDYLRSLINAVEQFKTALAEFLELQVETKDAGFGRGLLPAVVPRDDADPADVATRRSAVDQAAGAAANATLLTGIKIGVAGIGEIDPIAAWSTIADPKPLLEPPNVISAADSTIGRLQALISQAEAAAPPTTGVEAMHPLVWGAARKLWLDEHFQQAVAAAAEAVVGQVKALTRRNDIAETALWQEAFSNAEPTPGKPRLRWPGEPNDRAVKTMNDGLRQFAPGVQMTIRNSAAHGEQEMEPQDALERLATLSLLARWMERCDLVTAS
ncbi:TIGR02391 family protein [Lacisediminihabitans profunda]|uniref:TIGR02391 family protein n=2 Tax=Lacisediminihabitans profunda TaxID=2594790 RepID=A0A5C8URK4_9MICO|nr:TIGR02391 family protein [Lacisediminihabitans profunda]